MKDNVKNNKHTLLFVIAALSNAGGERATINLLNSINPELFEIDLLLFESKGPHVKDIPEYVNVLPPLFPNGVPSGREMVSKLIKSRKILAVVKKILIAIFAKSKASRVQSFYAWKTEKLFCRKPEKKYDMAIACMHGIPSYYVDEFVDATKKVYWMRTDYSSIPQIRAEGEIYRSAYKVVGVTKAAGESVKKAFPYLDNTTSLQNIKRPEYIRGLSKEYIPKEFDNKKFRLLSVGRLIPLKNFSLAIDAARLLKGSRVDFTWVILGDGELRKSLEEEARNKGVDEQVLFLGAKENPYPYFSESDIVVQTSKYEGKSNVIDEAKLFCKPSVVTNYPTVKDQITDGENGIIVEMSPQSLFDGIMKLISDKEYYEKIRKNLSMIDNDQSELIKQYEKLFMGE